MKKIITISVLIVACSVVFSQNRYFVYFKDKDNISDYSPSQLLSEKTLQKRATFNIPVDEYDLPVKEEYLNALKESGIYILSTSKWLNSALVETALDKEEILAITPDIIKVEKTLTIDRNSKGNSSKQYIAPTINKKYPHSKTPIDYGEITEYNLSYEIDYFHEKGYMGEGVTVAFLDVGYNSLDTVSYFTPTFTNNRIIDTYDFWDDSSYVYHKMEHGTACSGYIIGNIPGSFVGMAPDVNVMFYITDDEETETRQDEYYFVRGMERADSIGVDIISASVGYFKFNEGEQSYIFSDMDGKTAISTIGCNVGASKGIIIVNAAGNSGNITAPADAFGILTVGGTYLSKKYDEFSSTGPTYDGRIKPDVAGITRHIPVIWVDGTILYQIYGGTSTSTPFIAGLAACLKQANPTASSEEIINAIKLSGNQANNPDMLIGHGVPNARIADSILKQTVISIEPVANHYDISIYPNPFKDDIKIQGNAPLEKIEIYTLFGTQIIRENIDKCYQHSVNLSNLAKGVYILKIATDKHTLIKKIVKE